MKEDLEDGPESSAIAPVDLGLSTEPTVKHSGPRRAPKRRVKTGCLTCRKRRIKCGEEKPICSNCVKSKRICEGYARQVVFKNPLGLFGSYGPPPGQDQMQKQHMRVPLYNDFGALPAQHAAAAAQHPMLAPRPIDPASMGYHSFQTYGSTRPVEGQEPATAPQFYYPAPPTQIPPQTWSAQPPQRLPDGPSSSRTSNHAQVQSQRSSSPDEPVQYQETASQHPQPIIYWSNVQQGQEFVPASVPLPQGGAQAEKGPENPLFPQPFYSAEAVFQYQQQQHGQIPLQLDPSGQYVQQYQPQIVYVEDEDDDYYDVDSDEEMVVQTQAEGFNQLSLIMASANHDDRQLRSFRTHLNEPNILASYNPSLGSSPLNNPKTARIFAHFIHSTGPSLSIFERHPTDSSIVLGVPVPPAQQGLWTYTLPLKALENPALLQAILAISSLHIAYLQGAPTTVSLKHYHYALKRIGKAVGLPQRRKQIGTLAATELLAYYEVISADHSKWNSHVAGAAQLIKEIDFAGTTRDLRAYRRIINEQRRQMGWSNSMMYHHGFGPDPNEDDPFAEKEGSIDQDLIGSLLGRAVNFDEFGRVEDDHGYSSRKHFSRKDIENFRIQCDLYWWFTKQDVFHSLISGDKLFMPYYMQCQSPPRAGIGRIDAIYGSADHLWLLLARVTDFGYRDRKRKLRAIRASGTDWKPTPGMFKFMGRFSRGDPSKMKGPPGGAPGGPPGPPGGPPSASMAPPGGSGPPSNSSGGSPGQRAGPSVPEGPLMYGMVPPQGPARLPSGFADGCREQRESPEEDEVSDDFTYTEAEREWEEILVAMDTFAKALGRDFEPLPADVTQSISTPFGPALQYRTHTIAVIWGFYYAGCILLKRLHPSMPPAMMMAAGVAAPTTAEYAQIIGRITGGIYYPQRYNLEAGSLSPTLGSSLTEMTMPIFFAAVQYMDPAQRGWTIAKLRDVSRLTGWKTSDAIASGCEKAWIVAAKHGRGPPYERSFESGRERAIHPLDILERDRTSTTEYSDDRRFVTIQPPDRAYLAMGLLSLEGDMQNLEL